MTTETDPRSRGLPGRERVAPEVEMPKTLGTARRALRFARLMLRATRAVSGWRKLRVLRVALAGRVTGRGRGARARTVALPMRELHGRELHVRPGTSDLITAVDDYLEGIHLPPPAVAATDLRQIVELGSNNGSALASFAVRYPGANLLGVEPDPDTAAVARRNVAQFGDRCTVVQAGIWDRDTDLAIEGEEVGEQAFGFRVRPARPGDPGARVVQGLSIDTLLDRYMPEGPIDYLYMTIEGTEGRVLRAAGRWVERVGAIRLDWGIGGQPCLEELEALGFEAWLETGGSGVWTFGIRR